MDGTIGSGFGRVDLYTGYQVSSRPTIRSVGRQSEENLKQHTAALWADPDYTLIAERTLPVSLSVVEAAGILPGLKVLDIGASTDTAAIPACTAGARVVAYSLTSDLLDVARRRAIQAGARSRGSRQPAKALC
jgi:2-polyprenyl-6-hydroxyphenyl methylase/3-demethylubiquinone-9 3-methyltransferase